MKGEQLNSMYPAAGNENFMVDIGAENILYLLDTQKELQK